MIKFKLPDLPKLPISRVQLIGLIITALLLISIPFGLFLSQKTQIFKPRAFEINESVETPEITKAAENIQISSNQLEVFSCTKEESDTGSKRLDCTTPTGCAGHRLSRYHNYDQQNNTYQCYWSNECISIDPTCGYVDPGNPPSDNNGLKNLIYNEFKISFDDSFFNDPGNFRYLQWAWQILPQVKRDYPNFFNLVHKTYAVIYIRLDGEGYRFQDRIYFRRGGIVFNNENFFKQNLIHELGHVINGEPDQKIYNKQISGIIDKEGYLSSYAAGVTANYQPICINRPLNNNLRLSTQLDEEFAETIAYFLNPQTPELNYNNNCPPKRSEAEGNPLKVNVYPEHHTFIRNLLIGQAPSASTPIVPPGISYPDISSCKFTRGSFRSSIPSNTLRYWISEIAVKEGVPIGVLGSVTMHENPGFISNADDSHDAIKNNYYYIVSRVNNGDNRDTNAIGLYQLSSGKTPVYDAKTRKYLGIEDHCVTLFSSGVMVKAAEKLGKQIHDQNYYCVADLDERIRRLCQTNNTIRNKSIYTPDQNYDQNFVNLCNLKDNIAVGGEFLNWKLKFLGANRTWDNDQHLYSAINGYYGGDCTYNNGRYNYCTEVLTDKKSCNPLKPTSTPIPTTTPSPTPPGGTDFTVVSVNIPARNTATKKCKLFPSDQRLPDGWVVDGSCPTSKEPTNLSVTCSNGKATLSWDGITDKYDLRVNYTDDGWDGSCASAAGDFCSNNIGSQSLTFDAKIGQFGFWVHGLDENNRESEAAKDNKLSSCNLPAPKNPKASCPGNGQVTLNWDAVAGAGNYQLRIDHFTSSPFDSWYRPNEGDLLPSTTQTSTTINIQPNEKYYWVVQSLPSGYTSQTYGPTLSREDGGEFSCP